MTQSPLRHRTLVRVLVATAVAGLIALLVVVNRQVDPLPSGTQADRIEVYKNERSLVLFERGRKIKSYSISLGVNPVGTKVMEGDGKTPEGHYIIDYRNRESRFHLSLHVSYPDSTAIRRAER